MKKIISLLCVFLVCLLVSTGFSQTNNPLLEEGIKQYQAENYDEAIEALEKARAQDPKSSQAAFFLGMAYKKTTAYGKAAANLEDALKLKPVAKDALAEYIDVLLKLNKLAEAKNLIKAAREQNVAPANISFLEGLILVKEKNCAGAVASFESAKSLDKSLQQAADYQIGLCFMNEKNLKKAQERFKATASYDPNSNLAVYARQYLEAVESNLFYTRPLRVTLGLSGGYDSNVVSKPRQERFADGIGDPGVGFISPSLRVEYVSDWEGPWLLNAMYFVSANLNEHFVHSRDFMGNTFSVIPGYNFGRVSVSMLGSYTNYSLRTDSDPVPDENAGYKRYEDYFTFGPIIKFMLTEKQILELFAGYDKKNYYNQVITSPDSIRDAEGLRAYLSWTWFYLNNGFVNLRYDIGREAANGAYWDNSFNRFSGSLVAPVLPDDLARKIGFLYLQLTGGFTTQNYSYSQPYTDFDGSTKSNPREDKIYNGSVSLNWDITKNWSCILQYTRTKWDSNIPVYEYTRNLYSAGVEFRF